MGFSAPAGTGLTRQATDVVVCRLMASQKEVVEAVVRDVLGPLVKADGGSLYLISASDNAVQLHLAGQFAGCPGNTLVTRRLLEPAIHKVAPDIVVTITHGALLPKNAEVIAAATP